MLAVAQYGKVRFLCNMISVDGMSPHPDKTRAAQDTKEPTNVSKLRRFCGMVNQLGRFISNLIEKHKP